MLAKLIAAPFDDKDWLFEIKYDGYRVLADCDGQGNVELYSRNLLSFNQAYPAIVEELKKIEHPCLLDGEVVVEDKKGRSHFQLLQNLGQSNGSGILKYYVFDLLSLDGNDITGLALTKRKELLKLLLKNYKLKNIFYSEHVMAKGNQLYKQAIKQRLEGIMAKNAESVYHPGKRSGDWLKVKITNEQEAVIAGITEPKGNRGYFGSLLLGVYKGKELHYIGNCGTGFNEETLKELYNKFKPLFISKSPFATGVKTADKVRWISPRLVCQVKFSEWTEGGNMRHPVFLGLRGDKKAREVKQEKASV